MNLIRLLPWVLGSGILAFATDVKITAPAPLLCPGAPSPRFPLFAAEGWQATSVLGNLSTPRGILLDAYGNLVILERGIGVTAYEVDKKGCVVQGSGKVVVEDRRLNHAVELSPDGKTIFASNIDTAWSWDYDPSTRTVTNQKTLVTGMSTVGHWTRTLFVSRKNPHLLLVSVGSDSNIDIPSFDPASGRSQIRVFDLRRIGEGGVDYNTNGQVVGYGLRNDVGIAEDKAGIIHSIENSMDNAFRAVDGIRTDVHNDNPAEKVNRLGDPANPTQFFGGYPYCYTVWEPRDFVETNFSVGDWFVQEPNATTGITDAWCNENASKPTVILPPHTAPLDMKFGVKNDTSLYVPLHGSWNRDIPQGYKVVIVPGQDSAEGEWSPTASLAETKESAQDLLWNTDAGACRQGCFRPVALAWHPSGRNLYVTSDTTGEVFLLKRTLKFKPGKAY
ncbi:hypothetical protein NLJ89_g6719 [Agrocybe chaxingu]|uniref:Pyrroloquinoline quinone-dependent pyranose dehydrogenase beta-propeller domain-containing protein n=1 Tax=Agrocybe chaxingu TaxID=84603 RepID=A0A9W8JXR9_9AGAR|nr:hypothetical protein NLJ89_g6719 [Agrocybe chaxingu]